MSINVSRPLSLLGATALKNTSVVPKVGMGFLCFYPICAAELTSLIMCGSYVGNHNFYELLSTMLCHIGSHCSATVALCLFLSLSGVFPEPWWEEVWYRYPVYTWAFCRHTFSALWLFLVYWQHPTYWWRVIPFKADLERYYIRSSLCSVYLCVSGISPEWAEGRRTSNEQLLTHSHTCPARHVSEKPDQQHDFCSHPACEMNPNSVAYKWLLVRLLHVFNSYAEVILTS